jgi:hypothetical protein
VEAVTEDGGVVVLDDGAVYSVETGDEPTAASWSSGDKVAVDDGEESLTNLANGEKVSAKHIGDKTDTNSYAATGDHTQETRTDDGSIIVLDDHSIWAVEAGDESKASIWNDAASITVNETGGSSYELVNTDEEETVHANYIGAE